LLGQVRTDLDEFSDGEIACLENQGYALANVAVQRWTKDIVPQPPPEFKWPSQDFVDEGVACEAVKEPGSRGIFQDVWRSVKNQAKEWF
jgi:hypothetical protein